MKAISLGGKAFNYLNNKSVKKLQNINFHVVGKHATKKSQAFLVPWKNHPYKVYSRSLSVKTLKTSLLNLPAPRLSLLKFSPTCVIAYYSCMQNFSSKVTMLLSQYKHRTNQIASRIQCNSIYLSIIQPMDPQCQSNIYKEDDSSCLHHPSESYMTYRNIQVSSPEDIYSYLFNTTHIKSQVPLFPSHSCLQFV